MDSGSDLKWMEHALRLAEKAESLDEVPVGAVLVGESGELLGQGFNRVITDSDPTAHAEVVALREAAASAGNYRLPGTTLFVTLEPCTMCAGALVHARVNRVVFAALDPRAGAHCSVFNVLDNPALNHRCRVEHGLLSESASEKLRLFFQRRRSRPPANRGC